MVAVSRLVIAHSPNRPVVFAALMLQGLTGGLLGPTIAAISKGSIRGYFFSFDCTTASAGVHWACSQR
jgi:hypothetical protein